MAANESANKIAGGVAVDGSSGNERAVGISRKHP